MDGLDETRRAYVRDLLTRMNTPWEFDQPGVTSSEQTTSYQAHREAEHLCDPLLLPAVIAETPNQTGQYERSKLIWLVRTLSRDCGADVMAYLLELAEDEQRAHPAESLLEALLAHEHFEQHHQRILDIAHRHLGSFQYGVLVRATTVIERVGDPRSAPLLREMLGKAKRLHQIGLALRGLAATSTMDDAQLVLPYWWHKDVWIVGCVTHCFGTWGKAESTPLLVQALTSQKHAHCKYSAMIEIEKHADERALEPVISRLMHLLRTLPVGVYVPDSEICLACNYLSRVGANDPRVAKAFSRVRDT